jgi:hypothetical protein
MAKSLESPVVGVTGISESIASACAGAEAEREELDWLLTSGVLGRSGNLVRVLKYICEEHFAGRGGQVKEYTIATEALGRRPDFDPHTDTIVRVTVHSLRKRLLEVYQNEGAHRPMRLVLPAGRYSPSFVPASQGETSHTAGSEREVQTATESASLELDRLGTPALLIQPAVRRIQPWLMGAIGLLLAIAALAAWTVRHQASKGLSSAVLVLPAPQATIHALMGSGRKAYVDHSGNTWTAGNYCQGGTNTSVPSQKIESTEDAPLYLGGVRGIAHCVFPVPQGLYEMHFYFAETTDLPAATRPANLSINAGPSIGVDVVDDAGGDGIATSTVVTGVSPENDRAIHLDLTSEVSPLNAVEILPAPSAKLLPVRIVANSSSFVDSARQVWVSDRYFSGGRRGLAPDTVKRSNLGLYESDRVGRFQYSIPAVPKAHYQVKLYFREPWFGSENGGMGGPGSRIFDVACNGILLMKDFDILATGGNAPVIKTFDHIQASASGRIDLSFMPVKNYAVVNAIEVTAED